jgi:thioredoxin-related protein
MHINGDLLLCNLFQLRKNRMNFSIKIIGLLLLFATQAVFAQKSVQFAEGKLDSALMRSKVEGKPVFLFCYASWCPHCKNMKEKVFSNVDVADFCNKHFICVEQDMEKGVGVGLHKSFDIRSYPTFIFLNSSGEVVYRAAVEFTAPNFIAEAKNALNPDKQLPTLKKQFESDVSKAGNCLIYLKALKKADMDYSDILRKYFDTQSDRQLLSETNWTMIANGTKEIDSREFQFVLSHKKEYESIASPVRVQRKIFHLVKDLLYQRINKNDTANYFRNRQLAIKIRNAQIDSLIFTTDLSIYRTNNKWEDYKRTAVQSVEKYIWNDNTMLEVIAGDFLKNITDTVALRQAISWMKHSLSLNAGYDTYLLCARLYRKTNDLPNAVLSAKQAKDEALKYYWDHSEADNLLMEMEQKK